jgi:hypothetical protein
MSLLKSVSWHYKNPTKHVGLVQNGPHAIIISLKINLFWNYIAEKLLSWR